MQDRIRTDQIIPSTTDSIISKIPRAKIKKFLYKVSLGNSRYESFLEVFPNAKNWGRKKIYSHINSILIRESSRDILKGYREKMLELFDHKKLELINYLEYEIYEDATRTFFERTRAIEILLKLMESFKDKNEQVINNINIHTEKTKENKIKEIFGINDIVDAEIKE